MTKREQLQQYAALLSTIRQFFFERDVLEVATPLLSLATNTDPYIQSMTTYFAYEHSDKKELRYLQTSPEFYMKRLLAEGSGAIYQICKAFRNGEKGKIHQPEFTMLEWYRPGFDHHALMDEMDDLLQCVLNTMAATRLSYQAVFEKYVNIDPHAATARQLINCASQHRIAPIVGLADDDKDGWLDILMTHVIEPNLGQETPTFIYDYPTSQAALAKIRQGSPSVAERFEVYFKGIELANGFHELTDPHEQYQRFLRDNNKRQALGIEPVAIDHDLLAALDKGLPDCAGVALGIDRLFMLQQGKTSI